MNYEKLSIRIEEGEQRDMLLALLSEAGATGFEESAHSLCAFFEEGGLNVQDIPALEALEITTEQVAQQNWNAVWEADFEPVSVGSFCRIRAHFHAADEAFLHDLLITPKMSFGTGHHATTFLMVREMEHIDFKGKTVLDFGTGTGVLAILAEKCGAASVLALDTDDWSIENAQENCALNGVKNVTVSKEAIGAQTQEALYDVILANINRNVLLDHMRILFSLTKPGGIVLMSGLLTEDEPMIAETARGAGFEAGNTHSKNNWICIECRKP